MTSEKWFAPLTVGATVGCGMVAGIFFIFSVCIMKSLALLPPDRGLAAMQSINATIQNAPFFALFFGSGALCVWALVRTLAQRDHPGAPYLLAGALLYLLGGVLVTIVFNVPLNDALDAAKPNADGATIWANYLVVWTLWNHIRTATTTAATVAFALALLHRSPR